MVVVVLGVIAAVSAPSLRWMDGARSNAASEEIARMLARARTHAMMIGAPAGVAIDLAGSTASLLVIDIDSGSILPMRDAQGGDLPVLDVPAEFPGVAIESFTGPAGAGGVIWFGHDGHPERRSAIGDLLGLATHNSVVSVTGSDQQVTVHRFSGLVE